jgi:hypothetical protein
LFIWHAVIAALFNDDTATPKLALPTINRFLVEGRLRRRHMEIFFIELILWAGLAFLFWMLKDNLDGVETQVDAEFAKRYSDATIPVHFDQPEQLSEPIGTYQDLPIYRHARIEGREYEFSYVFPRENHVALRAGERYLNPGLVYSPC